MSLPNGEVEVAAGACGEDFSAYVALFSDLFSPEGEELSEAGPDVDV